MGIPPSSEPQASTSEIASLYPGLGLSQSNSYERPISVSTLRSSTLDKIQEFLVRGERLKACHFAMDEKLWAHAMLIASSIDKEMWKAVVNEFLRSELGRSPDASHGSQLHSGEPGARPLNGRESLRVAYSMFSGQGATCGAFLCFPFLCISHSLIEISPGAAAADYPLEKLASSWSITRYSRHGKLPSFCCQCALRVSLKVARGCCHDAEQ